MALSIPCVQVEDHGVESLPTNESTQTQIAVVMHYPYFQKEGMAVICVSTYPDHYSPVAYQ